MCWTSLKVCVVNRRFVVTFGFTWTMLDVDVINAVWMESEWYNE
jgi:hypothetical protein